MTLLLTVFAAVFVTVNFTITIVPVVSSNPGQSTVLIAVAAAVAHVA